VDERGYGKTPYLGMERNTGFKPMQCRTIRTCQIDLYKKLLIKI